MPTSQHKEAWNNGFVRILELRTLAGLCSTSISTVNNLLQNFEHHQLSADYLAKGGPKNVELALEVFPYAKFYLQTLLFFRILLFLVSIKWRYFTRFSMYLEITIYMVESFLPINVSFMQYHSLFKVIQLILLFVLNYFHWWPTLIYSVVASTVWHLNRAIFWEESLSTTMIHSA